MRGSPVNRPPPPRVNYLDLGGAATGAGGERKEFWRGMTAGLHDFGVTGGVNVAITSEIDAHVRVINCRGRPRDMRRRYDEVVS